MRKPAQGVPRCDKCGAPLAERQTGRMRLFLGHRFLAIRDDGRAEMKCPECHQATTFPARLLTVSHTNG